MLQDSRGFGKIVANARKGGELLIHLEKTIDSYMDADELRHIALRIGKGEQILYETFRGGVDARTLFDMASVTKIMATTSLALLAIDRGLLQIDDPVNKFFPTEKPLTVEHLLTHTMGIGHKPLNGSDCTYENIAQKILNIPSDVPIGTEVLYSCPGFILLGKILERVFGMRLDRCFHELVAVPLGLSDSSFLPKERTRAVNANLAEDRCGIVNDYNCCHLGGVAGNAGLFSTLDDVTKYARFLRERGAPLISEHTFMLAARNYTEKMSVSRGLGFVYVDARYAQTSGLFADGAIGHCGHTGQSVFVDYRTGFYVIILTDSTVSGERKYGAGNYGAVMQMRSRLHAAIKHELKM